MAGVASIVLEGTRAGRRESYAVRTDLSLGDIVRRAAVASRWRREISSSWQLEVAPRLEARRDLSFGRDLEEARAVGTARLRHALANDVDHVEIGARGDFSRARGASAALVLDRNAGGGYVAFDHSELFGGEWRLGYAFTARAFPDSIVRDHFEQTLEARYRHELGSAGWIELESGGERRRTIHAAPTSRDRFLSALQVIEAQWPLSDRLALRTRLEGEALHYAQQDSLLYFDYQVARTSLGARLAMTGSWTLTLGPRGEALFSRLNPAEGYRELGGGLECEFLGGTGLWSVTPVAGWRDYDQVPGSLQGVGVHSSYAYYEVGLLADVGLPAALRLRTNGIARHEDHLDDSQNARSVYISVDVRRQF
ncbi:MAG: hypothetical protein HY076_01170 [Candidatus Eisenbacteria bacterium]|uniref:Uncharacterized protein n=1 Tax=Eiseniibacteriota bacterium TaxID=2212470 RepID=A0A9D6L4Y2_UNCEI|nr:hypothetical protein [Candidatus Eisenbacteria bacterium]